MRWVPAHQLTPLEPDEDDVRAAAAIQQDLASANRNLRRSSLEVDSLREKLAAAELALQREKERVHLRRKRESELHQKVWRHSGSRTSLTCSCEICNKTVRVDGGDWHAGHLRSAAGYDLQRSTSVRAFRPFSLSPFLPLTMCWLQITDTTPKELFRVICVRCNSPSGQGEADLYEYKRMMAVRYPDTYYFTNDQEEREKEAQAFLPEFLRKQAG